jgi:predicted phosphodiesterase
MKKVLVFSDVHGDIPTAKKVINEVEHDVLLYLGD